MFRRIYWLGLVLASMLTACTPGAATLTARASPSPQASVLTSAPALPAPTLEVQTAVAPASTPLVSAPEASPIPPPAPTALIEPQVAASPTAPCVNEARFIRDLTIPDGMQLLPGQAVVKKWSVKNAGTCDWGSNYRLVLISGDALGAPSEVALYPAKAGITAAWEIPMVAPQNPGAYTGRWQARDPAGNLFGAVVFIKIEVIPLPAPATP
jgi:hypothetical protein